ncbi:uncharacterized protein LOC134214059 [Armigeres subalbatus]|uniref:uncharacterized protein LOC134214059 n=1 Tax=Armigeres subalbatus TaxID=124917 RepID=UPI002ED1DDE5
MAGVISSSSWFCKTMLIIAHHLIMCKNEPLREFASTDSAPTADYNTTTFRRICWKQRPWWTGTYEYGTGRLPHIKLQLRVVFAGWRLWLTATHGCGSGQIPSNQTSVVLCSAYRQQAETLADGHLRI